MKLETRALRYLTPEDWRVLTAVETGSRNHEVVPTSLIATIAGLKGGGMAGVQRSLGTLAKAKLVGKGMGRGASYDGFRLTYGGLDHLALHYYTKSDTIYSLGNRVGVGKESDIYIVASPTGQQLILKIHRLGRISFRTVKNNRDYSSRRGRKAREGSKGAGWMHMSRLAAVKEFAFMRALGEKGVRVPEAIAQNRHTIIMGLVEGVPLRQIRGVPDPGGLYAEIMEVLVRLRTLGVVHGDFNEFNIMIEESGNQKEEIEEEGQTPGRKDGDGDDEPPTKLTPVVIDFPQMISISHANATFYFDRDVDCIRNFFERKFGFVSDVPGPFLREKDQLAVSKDRIDTQVEASGFSRKMEKELQSYMKEVGVDGHKDGEDNGRDDSEEEEEADDKGEGDVDRELKDERYDGGNGEQLEELEKHVVALNVNSDQGEKSQTLSAQ